jgi:hypothetical protein
VLAGKHGKLDRNTLSASDLVLMAELQRLNAVLIGQNMPYGTVKPFSWIGLSRSSPLRLNVVTSG